MHRVFPVPEHLPCRTRPRRQQARFRRTAVLPAIRRAGHAPLDTNDRRKLAQEAAGLGMCNITKCCTEVCPEHIKITDNAIIPMKERVVDRKYDPVVWLGERIFRRDRATREEI